MIETHEDLDQWLAERTRAVEAMPEDNAAEVQAKAEAYQKVNESIEYRKQRQIADLWTAAFFWKIEEPTGRNLEIVAPTHGQLRRLRNGSQTQSGLLDEVRKSAKRKVSFTGRWNLQMLLQKVVLIVFWAIHPGTCCSSIPKSFLMYLPRKYLQLKTWLIVRRQLLN